jgi:hypothetical protein
MGVTNGEATYTLAETLNQYRSPHKGKTWRAKEVLALISKLRYTLEVKLIWKTV